MPCSRLVARHPEPSRSALRAWSLGPVPSLAGGERWSLPETFVAPDDGGYARRRTRGLSLATLAALLAVLAVMIARTDPFALGWRDPMTDVARRLEPSLDRAVAGLAEALGARDAQSPRGSSSGR
ncbi:MAG: hypothetical protein R3A48_12440 [Polyangiales bacterium]